MKIYVGNDVTQSLYYCINLYYILVAPTVPV